MLNRTLEPSVNRVKEISFLHPQTYKLKTGACIYHMKDVPNETARIELFFRAGKLYGSNAVPSFVNALLLSGTNERKAHEIQDELSSLGAYYSSSIGMELASISIYCLRENLLKAVNLVVDAIGGLTFDEREMAEYLRSHKQQHLIQLEKVSFLAQREFQFRLFDSDPRLRQVTELSDFDHADRDKFIAFHSSNYIKGLEKVALVANIKETEINELIQVLTTFDSTNERKSPADLKNLSGQVIVEKEGALQTAIRVGKILFNKLDPDYSDFLVLNTILGEYFGSRLMSNIREDKGYTYGIGSALAELTNTGYFLIATEVGKDVRELAVAEIKKEIEVLQHTLVPDQELALVQNYMLGQLLKSADGPYGMMDLFLSANNQGMDLEHYNSLIKSIEMITPERIQELSQRYLKWDDLSIILAG